MDLKPIYTLRQNFSIIGVTGRTGSGCSKFAQIMSSDLDYARKNLSFFRSPEQFDLPNTSNISYHRDFKQIFRIIYNYTQINWKKYDLLKYRDVLITILLAETVKEGDDFLNSVVFNNYRIEKDNEYPKHTVISEKLNLLVKKMDPTLLEQLKKLAEQLFSNGQAAIDSNNLRDLWEGPDLLSCIHKFDDIMTQNPGERIKFFHRVAVNYRNCGSGDDTSRTKGDNNFYFIINFINHIIKAKRKDARGEKRDCHVIIDSLRNSLEIMYLKERYSAFYMVAVKGERRRERLKARYPKLTSRSKTLFLKQLLDLDYTESKGNDFKEGKLGSPDVQNCIEQSDIHLFNSDESSKLSTDSSDKAIDINFETYNKEYYTRFNANSFVTLSEQAMKLQALIQQPGIITPTPLEKCMQIAYVAKANSGCISRQVGAVITNSKYSIKSVGWNDVPSGSTPCNIRDVRDLIKKTGDQDIFTDFEKGEGKLEYELNNDSNETHLSQIESKEFHRYLKKEYGDLDSQMAGSGKPCSFCFKTAFNKFSGEDNQVHTRSLHAEENAMLQISKYGGQALEGGYLFTTASPCELCAKKAYQLGINSIFYIDPYPGISRSHVLKNNGERDPDMIFFQGAVGRAYHKLYEPFLAYKDEVTLQSGLSPKEPISVQRKELIELLKKVNGTIEPGLKKEIESLQEKELLEKLEKVKEIFTQ